MCAAVCVAAAAVAFAGFLPGAVVAALAQQKPPAPPAPAAGPKQPPTPAVPQDATPPVAPTPVVPTLPRPAGDDLLVAADGTVFLGTVTKTDDVVSVMTSTGGERSFPKARVSIAVSGGKRVHRGEEDGLRLAWLAWLKEKHLDAIPSKRVADATPEGKAAWWADVLEAAKTCGEWKMRYAGAALLADGIEAETWDDAAQTLALELEPLEFPFSPEDSEKAKLWASWARTLSPLAGRFVLKGDAPGTAGQSPLWRDEAVAVRTRNLIVWSIDHDIAVFGSILKQGELTVRSLEGIFGRPEYGNDEPLEVRLFKNRTQYLTEADTVGGFAPLWSGGFFAPGDRVSRFYVTRHGKTKAFLEDELHEVLSHELTHHWIETRLLLGVALEGLDEKGERAAREGKGGRTSDQPGHWIVEGVARFVEDQAVLWKKTGVKFDVANAECIRDAISAWKAGISIPLARYLDITPKGFEFLGDVPKGGKGGYVNTERGIFYDQGGTFAFFMMNRRGLEGRKLFAQYLRDVYAGKMTQESWKRLGFATSADAEREFNAFLTNPGK
ncbi:MAG: hypothetical protein K8T90_17445 [Planctomycetes bacterium]|nr:hypothetical protein [Planctomycetota bacterium]